LNLRWHILTGEYPPQPGGVADYTRLVARGLAAAGDEVFVWAPATDAGEAENNGVILRRLPGQFGPVALAELDRALSHRPGRVLVQYTPHAFGWKAMNVPLCAWLLGRRRLDVMFHEVAFPFVRGQPWKHKLLASVHRGMAWMLLKAAERVFVSIPGWESILNRLTNRGPRAVWAPVPSNLPTEWAANEVEALRSRLVTHSDEQLIGHFGTYSPVVNDLLTPTMAELLGANPDLRVILVGRGGHAYAAELDRKDRALASRVIVTGELDAPSTAAHIACCDIMLQPYPDGISSRRGSAMAALALGRPTVTTEGDWSEPIWRESRSVALTEPRSLAQVVRELLPDADRRHELGRRASELYRSRFAVEHTIRTLRTLPPLTSGYDGSGSGPGQ
jgi:glycosyltransferase involved in cell wall biosynthesis